VTAGELHDELSRWADVLVIAPLSANTLAKLASGIADNLLVSLVFFSVVLLSRIAVHCCPRISAQSDF